MNYVFALLGSSVMQSIRVHFARLLCFCKRFVYVVTLSAVRVYGVRYMYAVCCLCALCVYGVYVLCMQFRVYLFYLVYVLCALQARWMLCIVYSRI